MVPELGSVLAVQQVASQRPLSHPAPATRLSRQAFAAEAELGVPLTLERLRMHAPSHGAGLGCGCRYHTPIDLDID